ncbi:ABC transporter permease [Roseomonas sp. NAR14]|uniref:ABC transporter permease n=1 Tax=Roseomonas acroporae TaxID=2937791 RepID=A0A9X2BUT6_9PROT|nr:ABC transporter permease [Roseomonas acroporae]MCK8785892.1 ABC transporter permease [Roseomonas acroporae]
MSGASLATGTTPGTAIAANAAMRERRQALWRAARRVLLPVLTAALALAAWEWGARASGVSAMVLVPPSAVWSVLANSWPILLEHTLVTLREVTAGFLLAAGGGIALGTLLTASTRIRQTIQPLVVFFQLIPKIALAPLFIVWLGVGPSSRLAFVLFIAFFPVAVSTAAGLMSAERNALLLCRSLTATGWQTFHSVRFPYAVPHIFAGLKICATVAMIGQVVGEFVTAQQGLGYIVMFASAAAETALVFAAVTLLCGLGLLLYGVVAVAEWLVLRWFGAPISSSQF